MKRALKFLLILFALPAFGGGYYNPSIDFYDPATGLYFKSVESKKESSFLSRGNKGIVNIFVFDPIKEIGYYLFPNSNKDPIVSLAFETAVKDGKVEFHSNYSSPIKNNNEIENREPKTSILVVTKNLDSNIETFFLADKIEGKPKKIKQISASKDWHVDVKNSKIRIISQANNEITVESLVW